jgi:radical SAM superfamily enzyme YgiQ (UPF0313 family)
MAPVLRYQRDRLLSDVPAYTAGLQLKDGPYLALSATELALYFPDDLALHYDLEGRLVKVAKPNQYYRRGLSGQVLFTQKTTTGIERKIVPAGAMLRAHRRIATVVLDKIESAKHDRDTALTQIAGLLAKAKAFNPERDMLRFCEIYRGVAVLPPDEYTALVLQATEGCSYDKCLFCELYRSVRFRARSPGEFRAHIESVRQFVGAGMGTRRSLFLGEANALVQRQADLVEMFRVLRENFELPAADRVPASWWLGSPNRFEAVTSFLDVFTGWRRTVAQWRELRRLGLRRVYIGMETGDAKLLEWLQKPSTPAAVARTVGNLKEAGIAVGVIILLGAGGHQFALNHVRETVAVLNRLPLGKGDYIYFSPLVVYPSGRYCQAMYCNGVDSLSPAQMREQERAIRAGLRFDARRGRPYIARYELESFVY